MNPELTAQDIEQHDRDLLEQVNHHPATTKEWLQVMDDKAKMVGRFARTFGGVE